MFSFSINTCWISHCEIVSNPNIYSLHFVTALWPNRPQLKSTSSYVYHEPWTTNQREMSLSSCLSLTECNRMSCRGHSVDGVEFDLVFKYYVFLTVMGVERWSNRSWALGLSYVDVTFAEAIGLNRFVETPPAWMKCEAWSDECSVFCPLATLLPCPLLYRKQSSGASQEYWTKNELKKIMR